MAAKDINIADKAITYTIAVKILSETEKNRLLCSFFHTEASGTINWAAAAEEFGSASMASFRRMVDDSRKKVKDAVGKHLIGEFPLDTPVATPKSKGGRKRKTADDDEGTPTPTPKKRASRAKATPKKVPVDDDSGSAADETHVKDEYVKE